MTNVVSLQIVERKAFGMYVLAGVPGYAGDFVESVMECDNIPVLQFLHKLLTTENPDQSQDNKERNELAAPIVLSRIAKLEGTGSDG